MNGGKWDFLATHSAERAIPLQSTDVPTEQAALKKKDRAAEQVCKVVCKEDASWDLTGLPKTNAENQKATFQDTCLVLAWQVSGLTSSPAAGD